MLCPACGSPSAENAHYCRSCGAALTPSGAAARVPAPEAQPGSRINRGWGVLVQATFALCVIFPGMMALGATLFEFPLGVLPLLVIAIHVLKFEDLLKGGKVRYAMALAVVTGAVSWLSFATLWFGLGLVDVEDLSWHELKAGEWSRAIGLVFVLVIPTALVLSAIRVRRATRPEPEVSFIGPKVLGMGVLYMAAVLFSGALALSGLGRSRITANQASAVGFLRAINSAAVTYESTYHNGFPPNLAALGPPKGGKSADATAAGLIDQVLTLGRKSGYVFTYKVTARDERGFPSAYTINADPVQGCGTGNGNCYFTDETGVIRYETTHPASKDSSPLAG